MAATARASAPVTGPAASRRSTTTISLPIPFILAKAWLASALMKSPKFCPCYMANNDPMATPAGQMTDLLGDGNRRAVLWVARPGNHDLSDGDSWMTLPFLPRRTLIALIPVAAIWLGVAPAPAQQA